MINYVFLTIASCLFSLQFLFSQKFQEENGDGLSAAILFSLYSSFAGLFCMLLINGFKIEFEWFSFFIALLYSVVALLSIYSSIKAFNTVSLGLYSIFTMLGGMLLPFIYGIAFNGEALSFGKILSVLAIAVAMFFTIRNLELKSKKAILWYISVFFLNGIAAVILAIHQNSSFKTVDSTSLMIITKVINMFMSLIWLLLTKKPTFVISPKSMLFSSGYSIFNTIGNWLILIALLSLPSSVQYPMITGGTMVFAGIISIIKKENFGLKGVVTLVVFLAAVILIAF